MAQVLGRKEDVARYAELLDKTFQAYRRQFCDEKTGVVGSGSQACQAFGLYSGLVWSEMSGPAMDRLVEDIREKHQGHLSTGILGTKYVLDELSRGQHADIAYGIANQRDFPGWGWMLENGATTLWEHWAGSDNTYSNNHPMFGSISQWFFNWLGGIQPSSDAVGFDKIWIKPQAVGDLQWVKAGYQSVRGPVLSEWKKEQGKFTLRVKVPVGATAMVQVPAKDAGGVTEGGKPARQAEGVELLGLDHGAAVFSVGAGSYEFVSE
jgi:alpha-L-rhamnosidase